MTDFDSTTWGIEGCTGLGLGLIASAEQAALGAADRTPFALPGDRPVWGRNRPLRIEHIRLEFSFDLKRRAVNGVATITFHARAVPVREAVFDAVNLDVASVVDDRGRELKFSAGDRTLAIDLGRTRAQGQSTTVAVTYSATPRRGLYFNLPDKGYADRPTQVWTQGQAEDSAHYFPCFDFPGEKFTSEALITVPAAWTAVSNGRLDSVTEDKRRKTRTFHWKQERPHPAYLITVCAGEFDEVSAKAGDVPVQYYGQPGSREDLVRAFGRTPEMVTFFSDKIGVPYPWAKYATVAVHDFIFGGMENTSATTMTDTLLHDRRAHADFAESADSITAHELAHQWFGDLLTCREWSHGWLNESFATYFDGLFVEHHRGWDAFRYDVMKKGELYLQEDSDYRRPIVQNVYAEPIDVFDRHLYERGSVVLDMLRQRLGDTLWWRAINHYVSKHAEGAVLTHDLQAAIEESTGYNLDGFFQQWVWKGGHPEFKATYSWDAQRKLASVVLEQTQKPDDLTSIYEVPIEIGFMVDGEFQLRHVEVRDAREVFVFALPSEPEFVSIDPANRVLKTLEFAPGEKSLKASLARNPEAVGRIEAARGLGKLGSPGAVSALREALLNRDELDYVRAEIATALGKMKGEAPRDALIAAVKDREPRVRRVVATALGSFRDEVAAKALISMLSGTGDRSYYAQSNAAAALGKTLQADAFDVLVGVLGRPAHNDVITAGALTGLGALRDERAVPVLLEYTQWGVDQNARRAATGALGTVYPWLDAPNRTRVRERLEELLDDPWLRVQTTAALTLQSVGDPASIPALNEAAGRALDGRMRRLTKVAARKIAQKAGKPEEMNLLRKQLEDVQRANQQMADRLHTMETRLDSPSRKK